MDKIMDFQTMLFSLIFFEKKVAMVLECHVDMKSYKKLWEGIQKSISKKKIFDIF